MGVALSNPVSVAKYMRNFIIKNHFLAYIGLETDTTSHGEKREDLEFSLRKMNIYVDVTEQDLEKIYALARKHSLGPHLAPAEIRTGVFYTNGKYGDRWAIYQVIDESGGATPAKDQVIFKFVAGKQRGHSGIMTREKFAQSVQHEVTRNENSWQRVGGN